VAVLRSIPPDHRPIFFAPRLGYYVVTDYAETDSIFRHPESSQVRLLDSAGRTGKRHAERAAALRLGQTGGHVDHAWTISLQCQRDSLVA